MVQENDIPPLFQRAQMHIYRCRVTFGQGSQLKIMRGEQRERTVFQQQMFRYRMCQCQAVESGCAAPHFVHQNQRLRCGVIQNISRLIHLHHKGRTVGCQIVRCPDAGENLIDRADFRRRSRNETAGMRHQHNQRDLPHISRFAAHIRAREQHQAALVVQVRMIGRKTPHLLFDNRMPPV